MRSKMRTLGENMGQKPMTYVEKCQDHELAAARVHRRKIAALVAHLAEILF